MRRQSLHTRGNTLEISVTRQTTEEIHRALRTLVVLLSLASLRPTLGGAARTTDVWDGQTKGCGGVFGRVSDPTRTRPSATAETGPGPPRRNPWVVGGTPEKGFRGLKIPPDPPSFEIFEPSGDKVGSDGPVSEVCRTGKSSPESSWHLRQVGGTVTKRKRHCLPKRGPRQQVETST